MASRPSPNKKRGFASPTANPLISSAILETIPPVTSDEVCLHGLIDHRNTLNRDARLLEQGGDLIPVIRLPATGYSPGVFVHVSPLHLERWITNRPAGFEHLRSIALYVLLGHGRHEDQKLWHFDLLALVSDDLA